MNNKLPRYLQRIKTFYNPLDFENSDSETEAVSEESIQSGIPEVMAATSADVEDLLKKYSIARNLNFMLWNLVHSEVL